MSLVIYLSHPAKNILIINHLNYYHLNCLGSAIILWIDHSIRSFQWSYYTSSHQAVKPYKHVPLTLFFSCAQPPLRFHSPVMFKTSHLLRASAFRAPLCTAHRFNSLLIVHLQNKRESLYLWLHLARRPPQIPLSDSVIRG